MRYSARVANFAYCVDVDGEDEGREGKLCRDDVANEVCFVGGEQLIQGSAGGAKVCVAVVVVARCVGYDHEEDLCWKIEEGRICQLRFDDWRGFVFGSLAV